MLRSLYSGVSGLRNHQTKMDVIGNNIANVNTVGFKASRVAFQDIYSQTIQTATAPNAANNTGGVNPQQIGLGMSVGSIDVMHTRGAPEYTGAPLDLSIDGDGFFIVSEGPYDYFTRAGNFTMDANNNLINSNGLVVQGWTVDAGSINNAGQFLDGAGNPLPAGDPLPDFANISIPLDFYDISVTRNGELVGINSATQEREVIARLALANFNNQNALSKMGNNLYDVSQNSGMPIIGAPGSVGVAGINPSSLEMSNVDLAKEFTDMITTQRGFQANSRIITTSDQLLEELVNLKR